jgi:hypothetical protein
MLETLFSINVLKITLHSTNINKICKNLSNNMLSMTCDSEYGRIIPPEKACSFTGKIRLKMSNFCWKLILDFPYNFLNAVPNKLFLLW